MANTAHTYERYRDGYEKLIETVVVKAQWKPIINRAAQYILAHKERYMEVENAIGVPWKFVGAVHWLECGGNWECHLHNGDPLTKRTRLVPRGYPKAPPANGVKYTWLESALDALKLKNLDKVTDWNDCRVAYELERYNGFGYRAKGKPNSPYLWSGSNHYTRGKYIADHRYDPSHVSQQTGAMLLYLHLKDLEDPAPWVMPKEEVKELKKTSKGFWFLRNLRDFFRWAAGTVGALFTLDTWGFAKDFMTTLKDFAFSPWGVITLASVLLAIWLVVEYLDKRKREDVMEGRHVPSGEATAVEETNAVSTN